MVIVNFIFRAVLFVFAAFFIGIALIFTLLMGVVMLLTGKKPRVIRFSTGGVRPEEFRQQGWEPPPPMKDVTPKVDHNALLNERPSLQNH